MALDCYRSEQRVFYDVTPRTYFGWYVCSSDARISAEWFTSAVAQVSYLQFVSRRFTAEKLHPEMIAALLFIGEMGEDAASDLASGWLQEHGIDTGSVDWQAVMLAYQDGYVPCDYCGHDASGCCCQDVAMAMPRVVWDDEYRSADRHIKMRAVRLVFDDSSYNFGTSINGTRKEIFNHYNRPISVSNSDDPEVFARPTKIQFLPSDPDGVTIQMKFPTTRHAVLGHFAEAPPQVKKDLLRYWANIRRAWNQKRLALDRATINALRDFQVEIHACGVTEAEFMSYLDKEVPDGQKLEDQDTAGPA